MKNVLYFPTFEPSNLNWIKYSLIYINRFSPIIPVYGESQQSDWFKLLKDKTDIVIPFVPKWYHGDNAVTKAIKEIENIFIHPDQYRDKLGVLDPLREFRTSTNWVLLTNKEKGNQQEFYIRRFGSAKALTMYEYGQYRNKHWD